MTTETEHPAPIRLLGLDFEARDADAAMALLAARDAATPFAYLVTPNADHLVRLARDPARYGPLYRDAAWRLMDSRVVARLARAMGLPAPPVVPGSDLTARLLGEVIRPDDPVAVLGGGAGTVAAVARRFGLRRLLHHDPPMGFDADPDAFDRAVDFVAGSGARFSFLCVGSPRQEMVARAVLARGNATGTALCVGASLLFLSGEERRAPRAVQRAGMEWAWRLARDPKRLARRYLVDDPAILALLWREKRSGP
ncbi:WecB/TagA/CpsF family glycosyltransferase [Falsiroseomonas algicola]|uniref:WecB/TagA/CpsF family glycosyltransferase n=1 Tax=Falsiroseomonas algicola TaxID=2716930 RepID=UPI001F30B5A2|nr:WecB/TagA/CpsF family glycosyltransferase [Falsiroseomonas algicola]